MPAEDLQGKFTPEMLEMFERLGKEANRNNTVLRIVAIASVTVTGLAFFKTMREIR